MRGGGHMKYAGWLVALTLAFVAWLTWDAVSAGISRGELTVAFLDVGQGDAIFIETPTGVQILIDSGSGRAVLREMSALMPWFDRSLDVIVATHPDLDHIGGLPDVLERYDVSHVLVSGVEDDGAGSHAFEEALAREAGVSVRVARRGQIVGLGGGVYAEVLFPDRSITGIESNTGSIILRLVYGDTSFLFTGDSPQAIEEYLVSLGGEALRADVLKVGHHGSKTSSAISFVGFVSPEYAVLSRGCNNRYGHPHQEVLDTLVRFEVDVLDTCEDGTIIFISDGAAVRPY